jgi:hypothetical protein
MNDNFERTHVGKTLGQDQGSADARRVNFEEDDQNFEGLERHGVSLGCIAQMLWRSSRGGPLNAPAAFIPSSGIT